MIRGIVRAVGKPSLVFERRVQRLMRWQKRSPVIGQILSWRLARSFGCFIAPSAVIGEGAHFPHPTGIVIGEGVVVGSGCVIYQHVTLGRSTSSEAVYPQVGADSTLYAGAVVTGASVLPVGTVVGANAVVINFRGAGENAVLVGAPARDVSRRDARSEGSSL